MGKTSHFLALNVNISKTVGVIGLRPKKLLSMTNRKSHNALSIDTIDDLDGVEVL